VYQRLATTEDSHASHWEQLLQQAGTPVPARRPGWRVRLLALLARRFGSALILPVAIGREAADSTGYDQQPESGDGSMSAQERLHGRLLRAIAGRGDGVEGAVVARYEGRHRAVGGNALRAAVLGANDGLVSNLSLVMGVAGAAMSERVLLASIGASAAALFLIGAGITLLTGRSVIFSGARSLVIGLGAAGLTWALGRLVGVTITG